MFKSTWKSRRTGLNREGSVKLSGSIFLQDEIYHIGMTTDSGLMWRDHSIDGFGRNTHGRLIARIMLTAVSSCLQNFASVQPAALEYRWDNLLFGGQTRKINPFGRLFVVLDACVSFIEERRRWSSWPKLFSRNALWHLRIEQTLASAHIWIVCLLWEESPWRV